MPFSEREPCLYHEVLPESERGHAKITDDLIKSFTRIAVDYQSAVNLCQWAAHTARQNAPMSDQRQMFSTWSEIGARAGAMYLYGFYQTRQDFNASLSKCPSLLPMYDRKELGKAWKMFDAAFPDFAKLRLGAAHPGELFNTPEKAAIHAVTDGLSIPGFIDAEAGATVVIQPSMIAGAFTCTIGGKAVSYSPNEASVGQLVGVINQVWAVMEPAFRRTEAIYRQQLAEKSAPRA
jgi:hypothetical protein